MDGHRGNDEAKRQCHLKANKGVYLTTKQRKTASPKLSFLLGKLAM